MDLLKLVDILLGVSVVMLIMSLVVTALTEMMMGLTNQKGRTLRDGLLNLLAQLDPNLPRDRARELAADLLTHPLVADAGNRMGHVIQRHELAELLLQIATDEPWQTTPRTILGRLMRFLGLSGAAAQTDGAHPHADDVRRLLAASDQGLTVERARELLKAVRTRAVELMQSAPQTAESARRDQALLAQFKGEFVDRLFTQFDAAIERTQARFAYPARIYTIIGATLLAFATHLDTLHLVNKLSVDDKFREDLVRMSAGMGSAERPGPAVAPAANAPLKGLSDEQKRRLGELRDVGVFPASGLWVTETNEQGVKICRFQTQRLLGILLSIALLTLGAPFWYDTLKNLIKLRSPLARRDDSERQQRQSAQGDDEDAKAAKPAHKDGNGDTPAQ